MTLKAKSLLCSHCSGPLTYLAQFCNYCRTPLVWDYEPELLPGTPYLMVDFRRDPVPGYETGGLPAVRKGEGTLLDCTPNASWSGQMSAQVRNGSVEMVATCLDKNGGCGVSARVHSIDKAQCGYALHVRPAFHSFQLERRLWSSEEVQIQVLRAWETNFVVAPVGQVNRIELRFADSILEVFINGRSLARVIDAHLGFGKVGWRVTGYSQPTQVMLHSLALRRIG
jgi:hypothetical protein